MLSGSGKGRILKAVFLILGLCQREKRTFVLSEHPVGFFWKSQGWAFNQVSLSLSLFLVFIELLFLFSFSGLRK